MEPAIIVVFAILAIMAEKVLERLGRDWATLKREWEELDYELETEDGTP